MSTISVSVATPGREVGNVNEAALRAAVIGSDVAASSDAAERRCDFTENAAVTMYFAGESGMAPTS